jgi:RNA polymerase sigma-54 factor
MALDLSIHQQPALEMRPSAELVAFAQLLAATAGELERVVERELLDNPALERVLDDHRAFDAAAATTAPPAATDPPDEPGILARLALDARAELPAADHAIVDFVLGSVDDHGFLTLDVVEIARLLDVTDDRVASVLAVVRDLGPNGFAARDVRECLMAQLDALDADAQLVAIARRLVAGSLTDLALGRYGVLARCLRVDRALVVAARDLIRERLRPFPVFDTALRGSRHDADGTPEIVIALAPGTPTGLRVELSEERRFRLRVGSLYDQIDARALSEGDRRAMATDARSAHAFVRRLRERWATIRRVVEHAAGAQREFVLHGPSALVPLTRAQVATAIGVHESTVSRAVASRSALLPCGRVVALKDFFSPSLTAHEALRDLIAREQRPLSDEELAARLAASGHPVARRTVAKYRGVLGIPPAARR